jgi:hydrogenase maturation protease
MGSSADPGLAVFAWGNISRGDDAIGPMLAKILQDIGAQGVRVVEDHQLNIEHVTDLCSARLALFIDASVSIQDGYRLQRIRPAADGNFSTHAISPQALLNVYEMALEQAAPEAWLLHVAARDFELGGDIGDVAVQAVNDAAEFLGKLCAHAPDQWREFLVRHEFRPEAVRMDGSAR